MEKVSNTVIETVVEEPIYDTNHPETILAAVEHAHGGWNGLWKKGDVEYTYDYRSPSTGKADVSLERYIFGSEVSYGNYSQHQINFMQDNDDKVIQYFNGDEIAVLVNGEESQNPALSAVSDFLRRTNYYWFTMHYKLNDKGTKVKYLGQEEYNGKTYDKIDVSYDAEVTGKEQNDSYIVLVNPETKLIDRFFFSIPFLGVNEPVIAANYEYENIDGQLISTKRFYFMPSEQGYPEEPNLVQTLTDIKFGNGFTVENIQQ
ncbi:DUF6503 family protein [Flagellimonas sp. S3867]|uniref:DUF6503 family protein n=1 Tax=Flagellimonas sp. S3867 TaxID=2768063 RepID=UPI0016868FBE|nr:DUF6503 family protein [Flagellimonas sp. S3867]